MPTWTEVIIKVMENHGGLASLSQIYEEAEDIKGSPLPSGYQKTIGKYIYSNTSYNPNYKGKDLFKRVSTGVWALKDTAVVSLPPYQAAIKPAASLIKISPANLHEEAANVLRTIKEYREYQHPDSPSWLEYIKEFVHVLGFSTKEQHPRLLTLSMMGDETPKAVLIHNQPGEEIEEIVPGFTWKTHLHYAAEHFRVSWGVLTNGLQLKVFNFDDGTVNEFASWPNFDEIILNEDIGSFMSVYNVFSGFGKAGYGAPTNKKGESKKGLTHNLNGSSNHDSLLVEFWRQLIQKANTNSAIQIMDEPKPRYYLHSKANKKGLVYSF